MKRIGLVAVVLTIGTSYLFAQGNGTYHQFDLEVDGLTRQYTLYVPEGHDGSEEWPLVFEFHCLNGTINEQIKISQMYLVADTAKFLIVYPQGQPVYNWVFDDTYNGWNVPDNYEGTQDDVEFTNRIINDLNANPKFAIDLDRIHATGFSNGGQLSFYLACVLSNRIASIAGVAAQMSDTLINHICEPTRNISALHIQGTNDFAFPINGDKSCLPLKGVSEFWAGINNCNAKPDSADIEDINQSDSSTVTLFRYNNCQRVNEVLLYRVNGGGHTWPGGWIDISWTHLGTLNKDINASTEIWNFFKRNPHPNPWVNIPDTAFLHALIKEGVDINGDSLISYAEAEAVTSLNVCTVTDFIGLPDAFPIEFPVGEIKSISGIEAFLNLDTLICSGNNIDSLDLSNNIGLLYVDCRFNGYLESGFVWPYFAGGIKNLNISYCKELTYLDCSNNALTLLDVSNNTALRDLNCSSKREDNDGIQSLNLSFCKTLTRLDCSGNKLESLDASNCAALVNLNCGINPLTSLDVSGCAALKGLECFANQLTSLDICSNDSIDFLDLQYIPTLDTVYVWATFPSGVDVWSEGSPNVVFSTECRGTGIYENNQSEISIYPNPINELLTIETEQPNRHSIEIISLSGQLIYRTEMEGTSKQIDMTQFSKGVYFVTVRSKEGVWTEKVVKL